MEMLNLSPQESLKHLCVSEGDVVVEGQELARLVGLWGLFRTSVQAPIAGTVEFVSAATGHIGLRGTPSTIQLKAYIDGRVAKVYPGRGVVVETEASFIQGIFGVGGERTGAVRMLSLEADVVVGEEHIPESCAGQVLVGGHSPTLPALRKAAARGAVGLITGSIDDRTLQAYVGHEIGIALTGDERVPMTLIITEGFGVLPMNRRIAQLLAASEGARCSINGATQVRAGAVRPEIVTQAQPHILQIVHNALQHSAQVRFPFRACFKMINVFLKTIQLRVARIIESMQ